MKRLLLILTAFLCIGPFSEVASYAALVDPPTLTGIDPTSGVRQSTVNVTLTGTNFVAGLSVNAGFGITVNRVNVISSTTATADFTISATATLGIHNVTVTTAAGAGSLNTFTVLPLPPTITAITPATGSAGASLPVRLTGTDFVLGLTIDAGADITVSSVSVVTSTSATAVFSIVSGAAEGVRPITVTTRGGTSEAFPFTVVAPSAPTLTSISPASGIPDGKVNVTLTGTDFESDLAVAAIPGITVSNLSVLNTTSATATFSIAADAAAGPRSVTVTTSRGGSGAAVFTVAPSAPTLTTIDPSSGVRGAAVTVTLKGSNFTNAMSVSAPGIAVTNLSVTDTSTATATFTVDAAATFGSRDIRVTTAGGTSGAVPFVVNPPAPTFTAVSPTTGGVGTTVNVTLTGTNFVAGLTVDAGPDITVSNINIVSATTATATLAIAGDATPGLRNITIATGGGSFALAGFTIVAPAPTLTKIEPATVVQGPIASSFVVTFTGTNFFSPTVTVSGTDITPGPVQVINTTSATSIFTVGGNAAVGPREVKLTTAAGTSSAVVFTVLPPSPTLTSISPAVGARGTAVSATLTGTNFVKGATTVDSIAGVTVSDTNVVTETSMTAVLTISPTAPLGSRSVTVTTPVGKTGGVNFLVADPFPDLSISSSAGRFGVGFNETYTVVVTNVGARASTGPIVVADTLPAGLTFVSGTGPGWSCTAAGQGVTCQNSGVLAPGASSSYTLTVAVGANAAATVNHTVSVTTNGDLNAANNASTDVTTVAPTPSLTLVLNPVTPAAGQQATAAVRISTLFPHDVTGSLTLAFTPNALYPVDDPAIQFATGGRTATFTIRANQPQATFDGTSDTPAPIGFQTGTVAGTLIFRGAYSVAGTQRAFPSLGFAAVTIPLQAPSIQSISTTTGSAFTVSILLTATSREVTELSLEFNTDPAVKLTCGVTTGCTVAGSTMTLDVSSFFAAWFAKDTSFGSLSLLRLPFSISEGTTTGTVGVTLKNSYGVSNTATFTLP